MKKTGSNAPQKPTRSQMPKCRPPKGELEIPKFMEKTKGCVLEELEPITYDSNKITEARIAKRAMEIYCRKIGDGNSYAKVISLKLDIDRFCTYYAIKELMDEDNEQDQI